MKDLYRILTPAQRCAALVASALRTPGEVIRSDQAINALFCDWGGVPLAGGAKGRQSSLDEQADATTTTTTTTRPSCPYPCAGSGCPHIRIDAECIACEARPTLDAHYVALEAWHRANPPTDTTPRTS